MYDDANLRHSLYFKMVDDWGVCDHKAKAEAWLASELGYSDWVAMVDGFTNKDRSFVKKLLGSNGYLIYKTMLARKS